VISRCSDDANGAIVSFFHDAKRGVVGFLISPLALV
jgi:hypothetical protein